MIVRVSVIIPAFNAQDFVGDAINSVLVQTRQDFEIVVCDDKSTDGTISLIESFIRREPRIRLVKSPLNQGVSRARNLAIEAATGHWISVLDADDYYHPERLEVLLELAEMHNADLVCDNQIYLSPSGKKILGYAMPDAEVTESTEISAESYIAKDSRLTHRYGFLKPIIRRGFIDSMALRYNESIRGGEDFDFMARCLIKGGKCILTSQPYYFYRLTPNSLSRAWRREVDLRTDVEKNAKCINLALLNMPEVQSSPELIRVLEERARFITNRSKYRLLTEYAKDLKFWCALQLLVENLSALPFFAQVFRRNIKRRLMTYRLDKT